jgi:hypothetical protein
MGKPQLDSLSRVYRLYEAGQEIGGDEALALMQELARIVVGGNLADRVVGVTIQVGDPSTRHAPELREALSDEWPTGRSTIEGRRSTAVAGDPPKEECGDCGGIGSRYVGEGLWTTCWCGIDESLSEEEREALEFDYQEA